MRSFRFLDKLLDLNMLYFYPRLFSWMLFMNLCYLPFKASNILKSTSKQYRIIKHPDPIKLEYDPNVFCPHT